MPALMDVLDDPQHAHFITKRNDLGGDKRIDEPAILGTDAGVATAKAAARGQQRFGFLEEGSGFPELDLGHALAHDLVARIAGELMESLIDVAQTMASLDRDRHPHRREPKGLHEAFLAVAQFIFRLTSGLQNGKGDERSEEHTSELQSLMRTSYAVFCLKK